MLASSVRAADRIDDEVDAAAVGELAHRAPTTSVVSVVDAVVHAVLVRAARGARRSTPWR